jgi:long-chain fatty acid transport protein
MLANTSRRVAAVVALSACAFLTAPTNAAAQTDSEGFWKMKFNFLPPGARATGLGGAFIAIADDATAAESNPAGLTVLLYPQLSVEGRFTRYEPQNPWIGFDFDPSSGDYDRSPGREVFSPAFASAVLPVGGFTLAAFRHELMSYASSLDYGTPSFTGTSDLEINVANYGLGVAKRLGALSLGVAGGISTMDMVQDLHYVSSFAGETRDNRWTTLGSDGRKQSTFVTAGAMLRLGERVALGGVYKYRGKFDDLGEVLNGRRTFSGITTITGPTRTAFSFSVPDAAGIGMSVRLGDRFTVAADGEWVRYSELTEWVDQNFPPETFTAKDGVDARAGAEYVIMAGATPVALRAGFARFAPTDIEARNSEGESYSRREVVYTGNFGLGMVLGRRWQFDTGGAVGGAHSTGSVALVYFFGRQ